MYKTNIEQLMIIINSVDEGAYIRYSSSTGKFYVYSDIWYIEGTSYSHSPIHRSTIEDAVKDFYKLIQGKLIKLGNNTNAYKLPKLINN